MVYEPMAEFVRDPDNLFHLPRGCSYRVFSRVGEKMDDGFLVPGQHDGMAAFPGADGRTILVRNHEQLPADVRMSPFGPKQQLLKKVSREMLFDPGKLKQPGLGGTTTLVYDTKGQML